MFDVKANWRVIFLSRLSQQDEVLSMIGVDVLMDCRVKRWWPTEWWSIKIQEVDLVC
jgi:hypothetical protein